MVCKRQQDQRDDAAFALALSLYGSFENARYVYATNFSMSKEDWDEGWGWKVPATDRAFAKMLAACYVLDRGIGAFPETTTPVWGTVPLTTPVSLREPICAVKVKQPINFTLPDNSELYREHSHAFVTNTAGSLRHYFESLVEASGSFSLQLIESDVTAAAGPGPSIGSICAMADDASPQPSEEAWCFGLGRPVKAGTIDRTALIWVFGRAPNGEVLVYYIDWYAAVPQWHALPLAAVLSISNTSNPAGRNEIPAVFKQGTPAHQRIQIVVRSGNRLYHFWRQDSNANVQNGWQAEDVTARLAPNPAGLQVSTRPTMVADPEGKGFHIFARNEHGALMQYTYSFESSFDCPTCPFPTTLPCTVPTTSSWIARNVDNEVDGAQPSAVITHSNVLGPIVAVATSKGALHVFQRKTDAPEGLFHYSLEPAAVWRRDRWWPGVNERLSTEPFILLNNEAELRPDEFPFDLYAIASPTVTGGATGLYGFQLIDNGMGDWNREAITRDATSVADPSITPAFSVTGKVVATGSKFEQWVVRNVFARAPGQGIVRHVWVSRSGWVGDVLPTTGWKAEILPNSATAIATPAANDFERIIDVFTFDSGNFFRHRMTRDRPWHSSRDYYNWASGSQHGFDYEPEETGNPTDSDAHSSPAPAWNANMECPSFSNWVDMDDNNRQPSGPVERASTMLHEATHLNKDHRGMVLLVDHGEKDGHDADPWLFHVLWETQPGELEPRDNFHMMYQISVEFLADVGEFPAPDLPSFVWNDAVIHAKAIMTQQIIDIPPWSPGEPRPLY